MRLEERLEQLVATAEAAWAAADWQRAAFPALAVAALEQAEVGAHATLDDWLTYLFGRRELPRQVDPFNSFGEPPVTLAFRERFALDLYFWHRPVVDVHNHSFDGAFSVVEGVSLHTRYTFEPEQGAAGPVLLGRVERTAVELLKRGDVRPIEAGVALVHQVAHLSSPCLSLVLRSHPDAADPPIYTFLPPNVAILQRRYLTEAEQKQLALVGLVARLRAGSGAESLLLPMLEQSGDLLQAWALRTAAEAAQDLGLAQRLVAALPGRPWHRPFLAAVADTDVLDVPWDQLPSESHRLVVALAKATADRSTREQVARAYRAEAGWADLSVQLAREMAAQWAFGMELPEPAFVALRSFFDGGDDGDAARAMAAALGTDQVGALLIHAAQVREYFGRMPLFARLLQVA